MIILKFLNSLMIYYRNYQHISSKSNSIAISNQGNLRYDIDRPLNKLHKMIVDNVSSLNSR